MCQESAREPAEILAQARHERVFPGAVAWLGRAGAARMQCCHGALTYADNAPAVTSATLYDLASLTKLFTLTAALAMVGAGELQLATSLGAALPGFARSPARDITLVQLLNHTSGIGMAIQDLVVSNPATWINQIAAAPTHAAPGQVLYSCTNYFLVARMLETATGRCLDDIVRATILKPLGMTATTATPLAHFSAEQVAPTELNADTGQLWHGVVHDEAARAWMQQVGTVCGNAGYFGTAHDLARFADCWCAGGVSADGRQLFPGELAERAFTTTVPENEYQRGWCWQIDAPFYMGAAPPGTAGHTGFTGPTFVLNRHTGHVAIVLNNRVHPTRHGPNRMAYHRALAEWCYSTEPEACLI